MKNRSFIPDINAVFSKAKMGSKSIENLLQKLRIGRCTCPYNHYQQGTPLNFTAA